MTIAVIGLGSMGRRRVRDLLHFGQHVVGIDIRSDRRADCERDFGIKTFHDLSDVSNKIDIDAATISVPPDCHAFYYDYCFRNGINFFSEANILTPHPDWFASFEAKTTARGFPSATWLFHPLVQKLQKKISEVGLNAVNSITHRYGGFLPDWHSWEPYYEFYAGRKNSSATREMVPFEVEILVHCMGRVKTVQCNAKQTRDWYQPIDDTMFLNLEFESGAIGTLTVELHQIKPIRETRVSMTDDLFLLQLGENKLDHYSRKDASLRTETASSYRGRWGFYFEDVYRAEIEAWLAALAGAQYPKSWTDDRHLSNILFAAELSNLQRRAVSIDEVDQVYDGISWIGEDGLKLC